MTEQQMKDWIDKADYKTLMSKWRFEPGGSIWFQGEIGKYYEEVMLRKIKELPQEDQVNISKSLGWRT